MELKNSLNCGTISDERKDLLEEAFDLFCKLSDAQLFKILGEIKDGKENAG